MKLKYLLPFFFIFNAQSQFKVESNLKNIDFKSKYVDISARDTFGLDDLNNIKGLAKIKYENNSMYFARNGLLNNYYGLDLSSDSLEYVNFYFNNSRQNIKNESSSSQDSPIGNITTRTALLNENKIKDFGLKFKYWGYFLSYDYGERINDLDGSTFIKINEDEDLAVYNFKFHDISRICSFGFSNGFFKIIQNKQDNNKFDNYLAKINYEMINLYYGKEFSGLINLKIFENIFINLSYDKKTKINISSKDYSEIIKEDFEKGLENDLRIVPRVYNSKLETKRKYLEDMFFAEDYNFSMEKEDQSFNINLDYILGHYSKESKRIGIKYDFAFLTYDFKQKELFLGIFFKNF